MNSAQSRNQREKLRAAKLDFCRFTMEAGSEGLKHALRSKWIRSRKSNQRKREATSIMPQISLSAAGQFGKDLHVFTVQRSETSLASNQAIGPVPQCAGSLRCLKHEILWNSSTAPPPDKDGGRSIEASLIHDQQRHRGRRRRLLFIISDRMKPTQVRRRTRTVTTEM
ncbi:hypothetical protein BT69DRAFT_676444 [Atractiella rhizophila]|nr:hypothetical protein BT69DRAFT_676444 [Atractiella rhizophila]